MILVKSIDVWIEEFCSEIWWEYEDIDKLVVVGFLCGFFVFIVDFV